jgi:hypothetical protein
LLLTRERCCCIDADTRPPDALRVQKSIGYPNLMMPERQCLAAAS